MESSANGNARQQDLYVIVNPAAGAGRTRKRWPGIAAELVRQGFQVHAYLTEGPGHATAKAREWLRAGVAHIVAVGGDGTVNEVVNGFLDGATRPTPEARLSVIPSGTGHDFARSVGIHSLDDAFRALVRNETRVIDAARAVFRNGEAQVCRFFVNAADVGLGAAAAAAVNRSRKLIGGLWTYVGGALRALWSFRCVPTVVEVDGQRVNDGLTEMVLIANGRFHAGGMRMAPMASPHDGWLEVLILRHISRIELLLSLLPRVYQGRHLSHPAVMHARGRKVSIRCAEPLLFEMDGEQPGTTDVVIEVVPAALRVSAGL